MKSAKILIIVLFIAFLLISYFRLLDRLELITLDFRYALRPAPAINEDIAFIEISEDSLKGLGRWPFPRDYHASLIDVLSQAGARMVIFDILFSESTAWDGVLAKSAEKSGRAYFPLAFRLPPEGKKAFLNATDIDGLLLEDLEDAAAGIGFINKLVDVDGKVRRVPVFIKFEDKIYSHLALKAACDYLNILPKELNVPIDEKGATLVNFAGKWTDSFHHYSYVDILAAYHELKKGATPRMDLDELKGKVCFVGLTATGTHELGPVPLEKSYPMVGVHANLFNMVTEDAYLRRLNRVQNLTILIILAGLLFILIFGAKPMNALLIAAGAVFAVFIMAVSVFALGGIWIDVVCPSLTLFAVYLYVTLDKYISEIKKRLQIEKELAVASSIQQSFLPEETPKVEGLQITSRLTNAKQVGGDLYDFIKLDGNRLGVIIGDVSGKGMPAALFMAKVTSLFKVFAKSEPSPSQVLTKINEELASDYRSGLFVTLLYAIFDIDTKSLTFSSAGHLPLLVLPAKAGTIKDIDQEEGMAAGVMEDAEFTDTKVPLAKDDIVVMYTDGVTEAMDVKRREFGAEGLKKALNTARGLSAEATMEVMLKEVRRFQGKARQHDDITAIAIKNEIR